MSGYEAGLAAGQAAYRAYGQVTGWRNFLGDPMPAWENLPDTIRQAWAAAALAARAFPEDKRSS